MLVGDVVATGWCLKGCLATELFVRQHDEYGSIHAARRVDERRAMTRVLLSPVLNVPVKIGRDTIGRSSVCPKFPRGVPVT